MKIVVFFKRRPQHLVLLLADWMSAIMLQAVFYGKSQFGVRQKVSQHHARRFFPNRCWYVGKLLVQAAFKPIFSCSTVESNYVGIPQPSGSVPSTCSSHRSETHEGFVWFSFA